MYIPAQPTKTKCAKAQSNTKNNTTVAPHRHHHPDAGIGVVLSLTTLVMSAPATVIVLPYCSPEEQLGEVVTLVDTVLC